MRTYKQKMTKTALQELRSILSEKELEDLLEEEPTSVAEEPRLGQGI